MTLDRVASAVEQGGAVLWFAALLVKREANPSMRIAASLLSVLVLLALPLLIAIQADRLSFGSVLRVLLLSIFNAALAMTWVLAARAPRRDLAALAILCGASVVMVAALLLGAMTPPRMF